MHHREQTHIPNYENEGEDSAHEGMRPAVDLVGLYLPEGVESMDLTPSLVAEVNDMDLPSGFALSGGAARDVLYARLTGNRLPVRDIDVVAFKEMDPDVSKFHEVGLRLMPDDYSHGHGVNEESLTEYFGTRDFTINEVAVIGNRVVSSDRARADLLGGVVRPTEFYHGEQGERVVPDRLAIKAVLLEVVLRQETGRSRIEGFDPAFYTRTEEDGDWWPAAPFHIALGFQKALEYGEATAHDFLDSLMDYGILEPDDLNRRGNRLADTAAHLKELTFDFEFTGEASRVLKSSSGSLADVLWDLEPDAMEHYEDLAARFGGIGHQYTDERRQYDAR